MRKSKSPANCAAVRVQAFLQAAVLHSLFCAICSTFLSLFMRTRNLCTHCFKQTASSTHVGRRLKISISPVDILVPPPSVLDKRHKLFLKNKAVQLRDFLSQVRPLHRGSTAFAFFGGSLFQQMMRMGPAWMWVSYSLARPVSLRTHQHYWPHYEFLRQWSKTRGKGSLPKWWCVKTRYLGRRGKCAFQTYHHSCCLPLGSMATFNLPPEPDLSFLALSPFPATAQPRLQLDPEQDLEDGKRNPVPLLL